MASRAQIVWAAPALDDLDDLAAHIAADDERAAARLVDRVFQSIERLRDFPAAGRRLPELPHGPYREVIVAPCRVIYRASPSVVHVVHVTLGVRPLRVHRLR